ncbi:MAG: SDR family NAD(P)-dependent oxidoreductase [Chloroflexi bacterium]|nr:SDR family NAD(P)-dependent oxidoreductase [Chloroflexota bacterium]
MEDIARKVPLITGAASGMGRAYARRFSAEGMSVVLADIDADGLDRLVAELREAGRDASGVVADVMDPDSVEALAEAAFERHGGVHVLSNNAGGSGDSRGPIWESSLEQWEFVFGLNMYGVVNGIRSFVPRMIAMDEEAHVVNTSSMSGIVPGGLLYGAAKHAVVSISETLYLQLRRRNLKVHAHALCPWFVKTSLTSRSDDPRAVSAYEGAIRPEDVAEAVVQALRDNRFYILPQHDLDELIVARATNIVAESEPASITPWEASASVRSGSGVSDAIRR